MNPKRRAALLRAAGLWMAWATGAALPLQAWSQSAGRGNAGVRTLSWEELVPKDWDPGRFFADKPPGVVQEGSERELALMRELREVWDNAPTRTELNGTLARLPGYVVPLEQVRGDVKEFLLVPYFGACIHSPPPPANQIVLVSLAKPVALRTMDAVWVTGRLSAKRADSPMGISGYAMEGSAAEPYRAPGR